MAQLPTVDLAGNQLQVKFPYNARHIHQVRLLGHARWDPATKHWVLPYSELALSSIQRIFPGLVLGAALRAQGQHDNSSPLEVAEQPYRDRELSTIVADFKFTTPPYKHQLAAFNFCRELPQSALFLEQGLGKAKVLIDLATWRHQQGQVRCVLVVCPNSVTGQWVEELSKHGHQGFKQSVVLHGSTAKRAQVLQQLQAQSFNGWIITNYDSLRGLFPFLYKLQAYPDKLFQLMVLDESSKVKHASSQRSRLSWKLGQTVTFRSILTGTPVTQGAEDIFSQYRFLKPDIFGIYATPFRSTYLIMGGFEERQVVGYKHTSDLLRKIYSVAVRFTKDQCLDLPPKTYQVRSAQLSEEQSRRYRKLERECVAELGDVTIATPLVMTKIAKLSQLTSGFIYEQGSEHRSGRAHVFTPNAKLEVLEEILGEATGQKVLIWCRFKEEVKLVRALLAKLKLGTVELTGDVPAEHRAGIVQAFQGDPGVRVLLGQVTTGGLGITLTAASLVVYLANTYSLEDRLQSEDRCHRIGQTKSVTYVDITAVLSDGSPTVDQDVLEVLRSKEAFAREVSLAIARRLVGRCTGA